jgi:uncharacterized protein DUF4333
MMVMMRMAVAAIAVACTVSGCTINLGNSSQQDAPKVSKDALQSDISQRLTTAGQTPQSVTCPDDLIGQLGQSVHCDVTMSPANSFEPIITVTGLEGTKVNYDVTPSVSKSQLEASVSQMVARSTKSTPDSVTCQSGLDGKVGAVAYCDVSAGGASTRRTVTVDDVSGLSLKYGLIPVLAEAVAASSLIFQLRQTGQHPDTANCAGDLEGKVGNTVECTAVTAGQPQTYVLTVTAVHGDNITYKYALKT